MNEPEKDESITLEELAFIPELTMHCRQKCYVQDFGVNFMKTSWE